MKRVLIRFNEADQIVDFVNCVSQCDYDADVKYGSCVVDAKSIVGVLSLAKAKTVELILHTEDFAGLLDKIAPYTA